MLSGNDVPGAGIYELDIDKSRHYYNGGTPLQYISNIDLSPTSSLPMPEPSSLPILLAGVGLIGGAFYFGRKKVMAS